VLLKRNLITLELRHVEINISSTTRIVQLAKKQSDYSFFDPRDSLLGQTF